MTLRQFETASVLRQRQLVSLKRETTDAVAFAPVATVVRQFAPVETETDALENRSGIGDNGNGNV
jgi:hypothetical protein